MPNVFFTSDTHFFHANFLTFKDDNNHAIRPFSSADEMNEYMVEKWNSVVRDGDRIYHLGDVTFEYGRKFDVLMSRLRGSKRLIIGNHDEIKGTSLINHFKKVRLWRVFKDAGFIATHIPIRLDQMRHARLNVHGHIHEKLMQEPGYFNVCVEHHDYTPVALESILQKVPAP